MFATVVLFIAFYTNVEQVQRINDVNRITNIKSAMALEDADFIKMVDELKIDYDETDLSEIAKNFDSKIVKQ